jgi:hypothetical protein
VSPALRAASSASGAGPALGARLAAASRDDAVRERVLRAVLAEVPLDRVAEVHLFAPLRQGTVETGVAVVAARPASVLPDDRASPELVTPAATAPEPVVAERVVPEGVGPTASTARHVVYTARYRLTVKGPDRGRWQVDVRAEADAPLLTVDAVVLGVQRRAGDASAAVRLDAVACRQMAGVAASPAAAPEPPPALGG